MNNKVLVITGPTASGKTALAIQKAQELGGEIINYDSLQVYNELKILTAYPTEEELSLAKHKLFGYLNYNQNTTAVEWARKACIEIQSTWGNNKLPILVGGTGLYLNILINGISPLPMISHETRILATELSQIDFEQLCSGVYNQDPSLRNIIKPENHHQMIRAWEIQYETGKSIRYFFDLPKQYFINAAFEYINLNPDRQYLYDRINKRFDSMIAQGAIQEVQVLLRKFENINTLELFNKYHIFKAIGAKEIIDYLNGNINYNTMLELSKQHSRNYAKRQITWFRYH